MAKCDICGQDASASSMNPLRDIYQQPGLKDVCPECSRWADKQLDKIRDQQGAELKRRICERAGRPVKRRWLMSWWVVAPLFIGFVYAFVRIFNYLIK